MKFTSIIITHFASNEKRSGVFRKSIASLLENTKSPFELIIIDNGGSKGDSEFLLELSNEGKINTYIKNQQNMSFGYARNQGLRVSNGDYLCIADNDIEYRLGWLEKGLKVLDAHPDKKIYATPVYNVAHWLPKFWNGEILTVKGQEYRLNARAGSNCWVSRRKDFEEIGEFIIHRVAGTKWTEEAIEKGYMAAVCPEILVKDMGFRDGYNYKLSPPIKIKLSNGKEVYFNQDEFKKQNSKSGLFFLQQRRLNPKDSIRFKRSLEREG